MSTFFSLFKKEVRTCFLSPIAFIVMFFFWVLTGLNFWWMLVQLADGEKLTMATQQMFGGLICFSLLVIVPLITMRLFAEERKLGTLESLLTTPVTAAELVTAKFAGSMVFYVVLWLPVVAYTAIQQKLSPPEALQFPDFGALQAGFLGVMLVGGLYIAIGLFMSSLTSNQIVAAISGFALLAILFFSTLFMAYTAPNPSVRIVGQYLSPYAHLLDFSRGMVDSRTIAIYFSYTAWFLFAAVKVIESKRT
ncbi:MAG: ABC transporter permease [Verrucomicrobiota bacterium]